MTQLTPTEEVQKRLDSLPQEIKDLLHSTEVDGIAQQIGVKNKLHLDQTGLLVAEINEVMTGYLEASQLPQELMDVLQIDQQKADAIAKDVNDMLFSKIREAMKKVYEANKAPPAVVSAAPTPPPPPPVAAAPMNPSSKLPPLEPRSTAPIATMPTPAAPMTSAMPPMNAAKPASVPAVSPTTPLTNTSVPPMPQKAVVTAPTTPLITTMPPTAPPNMGHADMVLSQKTVEVAPTKEKLPPAAAITTPPPPGAYKKDPYREPTE